MDCFPNIYHCKVTVFPANCQIIRVTSYEIGVWVYEMVFSDYEIIITEIFSVKVTIQRIALGDELLETNMNNMNNNGSHQEYLCPKMEKLFILFIFVSL